MANEPRPYNFFDEKQIAEDSFAYADLMGQPRWRTDWTVAYSFATATSLTVVGRFVVVGRLCFWQVKSSGTSLATTSGASYIDLPVAAKGYGGMGIMSNDTGNTPVGIGHIDVANSRFYPPTQGASGDTFIFAFWFEV